MSQGLSLHIGLNLVDPNHYGGWDGKLNACEADAEDMQRIADAAGYTSHICLTKAATRSAVKDALNDASGALSAGDIFFLTYSGHGGQIPDRDGDERDLMDETWCLYDGEWLDDETRDILASFAEGVRVLVLSDSCHSGTVVKFAAYSTLARSGGIRGIYSEVDRESPPVYRVMPPDVALRTYRLNRDFYTKLGKAVAGRKMPPEMKASVRLISGCQDNQLSMDGTFNGLFTGTLLQVWSDGAFDGNYREFHRAILDRMPPTQSPNHFMMGIPDADYDGQKPFTI